MKRSQMSLFEVRVYLGGWNVIDYGIGCNPKSMLGLGALD